MEKKIIKVDFHRQGLGGPIWGLFPNEDTIIRQYPAPTIEKAIDFFLTEVKEALLAEGYTHLLLPFGEEIDLNQ